MRALVLLLSAVTGGLLGFSYGTTSPQQVSVRADVLVESNISLTGDLQVFEVSDREVATQRALMASAPVALAASRATGLDLGPASTSLTPDSNLVSIDVVQPTAAQATQVLDAYLEAYFGLLTKSQTEQLNNEIATATREAQLANDGLAGLDAELAAASSGEERTSLFNTQSIRRSVLAQQGADAADRAVRLQSALDRVPVNVLRVSNEVSPQMTGFSAAQWGAIGAAGALAVAVLVLLRLAERRRD